MAVEQVKTWRERIGVDDDFPLHAPTDVERAMVAEIAELRARLAQCVPGAPAPAMPGTMRIGFGEAAPRHERRRFPEARLE